MRNQQREITNHQLEISKQRKIKKNAINDVKQMSLSHVITHIMTRLIVINIAPLTV